MDSISLRSHFPSYTDPLDPENPGCGIFQEAVWNNPDAFNNPVLVDHFQKCQNWACRMTAYDGTY